MADAEVLNSEARLGKPQYLIDPEALEPTHKKGLFYAHGELVRAARQHGVYAMSSTWPLADRWRLVATPASQN